MTEPAPLAPDECAALRARTVARIGALRTSLAGGYGAYWYGAHLAEIQRMENEDLRLHATIAALLRRVRDLEAERDALLAHLGQGLP